MSFFSLLSSFIPTAAACDDQKDSPSDKDDAKSDEGQEPKKEDKEGGDEDGDKKSEGDEEGGDEEKDEGGEKEEGGDEPAEAEEEEPEDIMPGIREDCAGTPKCAPYKREFEHCESKVHEGSARPHEHCVEELFHLMHCVDNCSAPKLFSKLR